jgi:hypothetical protein
MLASQELKERKPPHFPVRWFPAIQFLLFDVYCILMQFPANRGLLAVWELSSRHSTRFRKRMKTKRAVSAAWPISRQEG